MYPLINPNLTFQKSESFKEIVKIGRTHLMDATPLTLGQEFSAYVTQIEHGMKAIENALPYLSEIALGGTAVGTGINTHPEYAERVAVLQCCFTGNQGNCVRVYFERR